jgi:uncharacterized YigZ family protein
MFDDTYRTIAKQSTGIFRDRASKFIGIAVPVKSETQIKDKLAEIRKEYWDANHHCFAWQLGFDRSAYRYNDDGEPSGTAGRPIFGQIQSRELTDVLVVVVRYFGGTKLGVSGLINAYKTTASEALSSAKIIECTVKEVFLVHFDYSRMNDVMKILKDEKLDQGKHQFEMSCSLEFKVRRNDADRIRKALADLQGVEVKYLSTE